MSPRFCSEHVVSFFPDEKLKKIVPTGRSIRLYYLEPSKLRYALNLFLR